MRILISVQEINTKGSYAKVDERFKNRYRQKDVKDTLEKMYGKHCCYCESVIGTSSYGRIEHLKPKSLPQFYKDTFEWDNLHWCCKSVIQVIKKQIGTLSIQF